jgi:hypothetical protein
MARIFISHSSANNDRAIQLRDWLVANGWDDVFLDLDPSVVSLPASAGRRRCRRQRSAARLSLRSSAVSGLHPLGAGQS